MNKPDLVAVLLTIALEVLAKEGNGSYISTQVPPKNLLALAAASAFWGFQNKNEVAEKMCVRPGGRV